MTDELPKNLLVLRKEKQDRDKQEKDKFDKEQKVIKEWCKIFYDNDFQSMGYNDVKSLYKSGIEQTIIYCDDDDKVDDLVKAIKENVELVERSTELYDGFADLLLRLTL